MLNGSTRVKNYSTIYMFVEKVNFQIIKFLYPNTNHETIWSIWDQNCLCTCAMYIYILNNACTFEFCFYLHFCSKFFFVLWVLLEQSCRLRDGCRKSGSCQWWLSNTRLLCVLGDGDHSFIDLPASLGVNRSPQWPNSLTLSCFLIPERMA